VSRGGELVVSVRTDPQSFLWYTKRDSVTQLVDFLTQARLLRVDRTTQHVEPWLAESWTRSADGRQYTVKLRPGLSFSDGHPFTADDVVFSFRAAYDAGSVIADSLQENGKRLQAAASDATTVVISFAEPFGPGLRILDNLPILPRHKLETALNAGTFARAWGVNTPPQDMTGLGPFVLTEYVPGQRMRFTRNARYFRKDANGIALPYLDRLLIQVVPDQDTELLRLEAGQIDMTSSEMRPQDYAPLRRAADAGRVQVFDLGAAYDPDSLWFNLKPGGLGSDPRAAWLQREELRQAVSLAVDRQLFADTVYLGAATPAFGPITTANKEWYSPDVPHTPHDPERAKSLLASIGLTDRNGDGILEDARGEPARFTLMTQKGLSSLERGSAVIRDELKKIGLVVDVAPLEGNAVIQRFLSGHNYDAVYFRVATTDTDPAINPDYWLSAGTSHVWNLAQPTPATPWERQIDELMTRQMTSSDQRERKQLFDQVQKIFAEHLPVIHFVVARVYVAASTRATNLTPAVLRPQFLWSPDTIAVRH
jgi:peptide/nickel transport system substrate-binding protein